MKERFPSSPPTSFPGSSPSRRGPWKPGCFSRYLPLTSLCFFVCLFVLLLLLLLLLFFSASSFRAITRTSLLFRRFVFLIVEASAKREWLVMNRKGPWVQPSLARTFSSIERRLGTRQNSRGNGCYTGSFRVRIFCHRVTKQTVWPFVR